MFLLLLFDVCLSCVCTCMWVYIIMHVFRRVFACVRAYFSAHIHIYDYVACKGVSTRVSVSECLRKRKRRERAGDR